MNDILSQANQLKTDEIFEFMTPFVPAPVIDILKSKGFRIFSIRNQENVVSYISR